MESISKPLTVALAVAGVALLVGTAYADMPARECLNFATIRANEILRVLNSNQAPVMSVLRYRQDPCTRRTAAYWLSRRLVITENNEFFREFVFPSGTRHYLRATHDVYNHDNVEVAVLCPNGGALAFNGVDQIVPQTPGIVNNKNVYFDDIDDIEILSVYHVTCDSRVDLPPPNSCPP